MTKILLWHMTLFFSGYKMNKQMRGVSEFQFQPLTFGHSLNVTIAITGWLSETHKGIVSTLGCKSWNLYFFMLIKRFLDRIACMHPFPIHHTFVCL